ncbi:MAG: site-specific integrase, partial [Patescibacteria group bacterium]
MHHFTKPDTKIETYAKEFLEHLEIELNRSPKTLSNYSLVLKQFFDWGNIAEPREITQEKIREYRIFLN